MSKQQKTQKYATPTEELQRRLDSGEIVNPVTRSSVRQIIENRKNREKSNEQ